MVEVHLWSGLRGFVAGQASVSVKAATVGEMLEALVADYPALKPVIDAGVSVAVDGRVIASDLTAPVTKDSEIYLMQRLRGG